jgi:hypothetical protein
MKTLQHASRNFLLAIHRNLVHLSDALSSIRGVCCKCYVEKKST